jgi:outer membrane protein OmpA-like peptidoglycan-associated protein
MKRTILTAFLILTSATALPSYGHSIDQSVVVDKRGNPVRSILSGECVLTKWKDDSGLCNTAEVAEKQQEPKKKIFSTTRVEDVPAPETRLVSDKRAYIVFFDHDKSSMTDAAKDVLNDLSSMVQGTSKANLELTGHADRSGSDAYNEALSERRALAVKKQLVQLGIPADNVSVTWKGESEPLVQTDDGIKEPQNRRTEIKVFTEVRETR